MALPSQKQSRASQSVTPYNARVMLAGMPGAGKSTLAASWAPNETLIIDTQQGTTLLDGEHFVVHVSTWPQFETIVNELTSTEHQFKVVVIDMIDDIWNFVDAHCAKSGNVLASASDDYNRAAKTAEGTFRQTLGKLIASPLGIWMLSHTKEQQDGNLIRYRSKLDNRVLTYVQGACQFVLLAETLGPRRKLHTAPSAKFEAKSRVSLPESMDLDARALWIAMARGLSVNPIPSPSTPDLEATPS
jgi:hypothetical protein